MPFLYPATKLMMALYETVKPKYLSIRKEKTENLQDNV